MDIFGDLYKSRGEALVGEVMVLGSGARVPVSRCEPRGGRSCPEQHSGRVHTCHLHSPPGAQHTDSTNACTAGPDRPSLEPSQVSPGVGAQGASLPPGLGFPSPGVLRAGLFRPFLL